MFLFLRTWQEFYLPIVYIILYCFTSLWCDDENHQTQTHVQMGVVIT